MNIATYARAIRRNVAGLSLMTMIASIFIGNVASAATFTDVPPNNQWYPYVEQLAAAGAIDTTAGTYNPDSNATRGQIAKVVVKMAGYNLVNPATPSFTDVAPGTTFYTFIETAKAHGVLNGYKDANGNLTGVFGVNDVVTREQMAKIVVNAKGLASATCNKVFPDVTGELAPFVTTLYCWSVVDGYDNATVFHPTWPLTRGAIAKFVSIAFTNPVKRPDVPTNNGAVNVMLANNNPATGTVVAGQATADLAHFTFTGNGTINSIKLKRSGISDQNTLTNVYLYDGVTRLTDGYSFNNNSELTMSGLGIPVNGSRTLSVRADVSPNAPSGQTIAVALTGFNAGSDVAVNYSGNLMPIASGSTLASAYLPTQASVAVPNAQVNAGTSAYTVWSAPIQINLRTLQLKGANFRVIGSAPATSFTNIKMFVDGVDTGKMATMTTLNGSNYATFDFSASPVQLQTGSHTLDVRADIAGGASFTGQFSIQNAADLMIFDPQVGVNIAPQVSNGVPFTANNAGTITINAGSASVTVDPTFSALTNITGGATNTTIGKFKIHGYGEDVKVQSLTVDLNVGGNPEPNTHSLNNVTLYFNGTQIGSQQNYVGAPLTFNLGSQMILPAGMDSSLEVKADLQNSTNQNYTAGTVGVTLEQGNANAQGQSSHNTLNFPTTNVVGNTLTIQTGVLAVSKAGTYASPQSVTPNTANVKIGSYVLQNQSSSESVRVTGIQVNLFDATDNTPLSNATTPKLTNFSNLKTSETSGSGTTPVQPQATNNFSVDFTLAPGATKTIDVFADVSSETANGFYTTFKVTALGTNSNVAISQNGDATAVTGQTINLASGTLTNPPTIVAASSTVPQYIATAGGAVDASKATFNLTATGGSATISELKFNVTESAPGTVTQVRVGNVTAPVVNGTAYLTGLNLVVPQGGSGLNIDAFVSYANTGNNGIASGSTSTLKLQYIKYTSGGTTGTLCTAGCTDTLNTTVDAPTMTLVGSKPTISLALPNGAGGSQVSGLTVGTKYIADVKVTADTKGDIKINTLPLVFTGNAAGTHIDCTNAVIKDATGTIVAGASASAGVTNNTSSCLTTITFANGYTIAAGASQTFRIEVPISALAGAASGDSIAVGIGAAGAFTWTDIAGGGNAGAETGTLITNYPTSTISMTTS